MASVKTTVRKRTRQKVVFPRTDENKTSDLDVGLKFELFWQPTSSWSSAEIKWNWGDGSYVIQCNDDDDTPLTYYIDQYKYRYQVTDDESDVEEPPKKKRKLSPKTKKKKKKEKPQKPKLMKKKLVRSKKRPKKRSVGKVVIRREPNYSRLRIEKLFEDELQNIEDIEDSFMDFGEKISLSFGLRRLSLESFRAVNISDEKLIRAIFTDKQNIADPWINWSCNVHHNCLDIAIKKGNIAMVEVLLKLKKKQKYAYNRIALPSNRLKVSSGHVGAATFGHRIRAVKASRGGKEGNNAFIKDDTVHVRSLQEHFDYALEIGSSYDMIELFMKQLHINGLPRPIEQVSDNGLLYKAAAYGHIDIVRKYIALLSQHDGDGKSWGLNQLHCKVIQDTYVDLGEFRNVSVTKKALEGNHSLTPLHLAAINPDIAYLQQMVEQSNIVDHTDDLRRTPLFFAAACSSPEPLRYLISKGAKLDVRGLVSRNNAEDEISPLLIAVKYGKAHNIAYLLGDNKEEKAEEVPVDKTVKYGEIVNLTLDPRSNKKLLHIAAYYGHAECVAELLEYGAQAKAVMKGTRLTAMHLAAQFGHLETCKILTEHRLAQRNKRALLAKDNHKRIPIILAIMNGHLDVVKYMLSHGAPSYTTDSSGNSAIHYAAAYGWNDILKCLMEAPFANPGVFNMWKLSPFFIAMIKGNDLCASTLLDTKDFDVNAVDSEGKSILHYMLENKNANPVKSLKHLKRIVIDLGANVNVFIPKTKETPLHILANNTPSDKDGEMAHILMQKGARPDYQNIHGYTPISFAIQHQNFKLFEAFISKFDVNIAGKPKRSIDWKREEEKQRRLNMNAGEPVQEEKQEEEEGLTKELNLNTSLKDSWLTPLMMAIQLNPPNKAAKKPKKRKRKKKKKVVMPHGANIGRFAGSTFDQPIHFDSNGSDHSDDDEEDEEEKLKQKRKEEEEEKERNEPGETIKQRRFREERLNMINLICIALNKYDGANTLNTFCKGGHNALFYAVQCQCYEGTDGYIINYGSVEITNALMKMGADPDTMNDNAETVISYILENSASNRNVIQILTPILNVANVNKQLVIYEKKKKIQKKKKDKEKIKEIKVRRDSYLTTAIHKLSVGYNKIVIDSLKYGIIELLIKKGAKLEVLNEVPAMIKIIQQCQYDEIFESHRFEVKHPPSKHNCIGFQLIGLLLKLGENVNLNVVDDPKNANAKSLLSFVIDLIQKESQSKQSALFNQINLVETNYYGRDTRVIDHKKRLYRDRVLRIPLISEAILQTLLSYNECKIEINEKTILEAIKLSSLEGALKSQNLFDESLEKEFEAISLRGCKMLLQYGNVNLNTYDNIPNKVYNPLIDALDGTNKDLTRKLLKLLIVDHKMNINRQDKRGVILSHAIKKNDYKSIELMVENGLNVNNAGWSTYHVDNSDKPNKIGKHPVVELVELGAGHHQSRYRPEILDAILSQNGIDVELQNEFCVILTKQDRLVCSIQHNVKTIEIEFIPYKYKNEESKWMLTKTFSVDHLALFAYKSAYQLYKKHYKQSMDKRFSSPLWKQAIEILINCQWSLAKATNLFKQFKYRLSEAIKIENNRRKLIREKYKKQEKYIAKIHKNKNKKEEKEEDEQDEDQDEENKMDLDNDNDNDGDDDYDDVDVSGDGYGYEDDVDDVASSVSSGSLDSEERNAIDSDDEMKKLEDYKSELKDDIDPEAIKEADLAPLITTLCKDWKYPKQKYDALVNKWYYAHRELVVGDAAWQLCREQARNDETQARRNTAIDKQRKELQHLRDLRKQLKNDNTKYMMNKMIRNKDNIPDFTVLDERDKDIEQWNKAKKHGEPPLIPESDLEKINGVDCTQKVGSQEIKNSFKAETKTLRFTQSDIDKYQYEYDGDIMMTEIEPNALFYCISHNKEHGDAAKSQSLGYLYLLPSIYDVKNKKNNIYVEIAKHHNCKKDALELIKTYYKHKGDLNATDKDGKTMIMHAIANNNLELIEWLLSKKVNLNNESKKMHNNIFHIAVNHISDKSLNIRQLLYHVIGNIKCSRTEKQQILKVLSNQYNADGYTPLLLAIKHIVKSPNSDTDIKYKDYFKHKEAVDEWQQNHDDLEGERAELKKQNVEKWYKQHPIDYIEIDLDEIPFEIVCAEWKVSPKPVQTSTSTSGADANASVPSIPSLFDNLNTQDKDMLMSSQPLSDHTDMDEDEEKEIILREKNHDDTKADADTDTDREPDPAPIDVTSKLKGLISDGTVNIDQYRDLHEYFDTKDWDDRKWTLEITYSFGDYMATVFTEQNEEPEQNEHVQHYNMWGGFGGYGATNTSGTKLTKPINIPRERDRIKQVYHYRLSTLFKKYKKSSEHILDHIDIKCDGKEHETYVFLCKKLRIKPQFAYPIAIRKPKSKVKDKRQKDFDDEDEDEDVDIDMNDYYEFKNERNDVLTDDAESESDYELPHDPPGVIHTHKPKITEEYSAVDFLAEFVNKCYCDVDKQTKLTKSYVDRLEKEEKEREAKTDQELIDLTAAERSSYFRLIDAHLLKLWNIDAPWLTKMNMDTQFAGFSPLHYASYHGDYDLVKLFVSLGTHPNLITYQSNATALMIHCRRRNDTNIVNEILSDKRCNVNLSDSEGLTALTFAVNFSGRHLHDSERLFRETFQIERILLKHNANINHQDIYGRTAAHYIFVTLRENRCHGSRDPIELVSDLCSAGHKDKKVNVDIPDMFGRTPIHYAAMLGAQISSNWLTKEGAEVKGYPDFCGNEPFQHSILNKQIALTVDYINQGVDVKHMLYEYTTYKERSSFRQCLELKWMGVAYLMVSRGVEITLAVEDALETENYQLAKTLLYKTQSVNLRNRTPEHGYTLHHIVSKYSPKTWQSKQAFEHPWSVRIIEILDEQNVDSKDVLDKFRMTPLHYAVLNGHCNLARHYIETNKLDSERLDGIKKERPLVTALYNNDKNMVRMLVESIRVDVTNRLSPRNTRQDGNRFPIHIAVTKNNYDMCKILLNNGSSTKHEYEYKNRRKVHGNGDRTVLHSAIRHSNYELTKLILEHNADVHATLFYDNLQGYSTCLHVACSQRNKQLIELLIAYKCKINEVLRYSAIQALDESSEEARKKDLPRWKDEFRRIHAINCIDKSALHIVCRRFNDYALTKLLIEYSADVNKLYRKELLENRHKNSKDLLKLFHISTRKDHPDLCLLHSMVRNKNYKMVELLLSHGADPNIKMYTRIEHEFGEETALHTAVRHNDAVCAELLLKSKANPNELYIIKKCKNSDLSPIHTAVGNENGEMVTLLLKSGSDPNQRMIAENSEYGELYAIHVAVENENIEITQNVLKHGADPNVKLCLKRARYGDVAPIHVAVRFGNYALIQLLLLYGADPNIKLSPKKENEIIWKWRSNAGDKEYDETLSILIEKQHESYLNEKKAKKEYLDEIKKANKNLTNKRKPDADKMEAFDAKIEEKSRFYLRIGSFFERNDGYFIDFASFNQKNEHHNSKSRKIVRYEHPVDIHCDGGSALWMAVRNRDLQIVSLLVNYHCDMNVTNKRLETPLIYAIKQNDLTLAAILMRGAVYYNTKYKEKIYRGMARRKQYSEHKDDDEDDDDEDGDIDMTKKRTRKEIDIHRWPSKKRKISHNTALLIDDDRWKDIKFIPIDVCLKDAAHGYTALHHTVITDGIYNASFENETMLQLLVNGDTLSTQHLLQTKVDTVTPFKNELSDEERKETDWSKPHVFESKSRTVHINIEDKDGNAPIYYALLQRSGKMKSCLEDLGARMNEKIREKAENALLSKHEKDEKDTLYELNRLYGDDLFCVSYNVVADARNWRKEFFIEEDEEDSKGEDAEKVQVDFPAKKEIGKKGYVLSEDGDVFNWDGLYVNVDKGKYGAYMFYKLQLLYQPIQKLSILWCRWGRPGETGNFQRTPYTDKDEAIKEFKKIFESKTLNKWEDRRRDTFIPKRWRIVRKKRRRHKISSIKSNKSKEDLNPHNLVNSIKEILRTLPKAQRPKSALPQEIENLIYTIFDIAAFTQSRRRLGLNDDIQRLGYLEDQDLDKCYQLIQNISLLVKEQDEENIKTSELQNKKYKLEKEMRERHTTRERNKNVFCRNEQRLKQEITRLNAAIRSLKTKQTNMEKIIETMVDADENCPQKISLKETDNEWKEKEKERKGKETQWGQMVDEEDKRKTEEKAVFSPLDEKDEKDIEGINTELTTFNTLTQERRKRISHLSNEYYLLMPRTEFSDTYITAIDNRSLVNKYLKIMMSLSEYQIAISALMAAQYNKLAIHPIDYCYISLKCKMLPLLPQCCEFKLILSYMNRTASPIIDCKKVKIYEIWKENEEEEFARFSEYSNRMLLWHGSDTANVCGILSSGLKVAPPEADATGYMFGKGIYFADSFQKSRGYASTGNRRNTSNLKFLFLCQVALGKMYEAITAEYMEEAKHGFNSTKGLGRRGPNPSHIKTTYRGEIIPDSPTINYPQRTTRDKENKIVPVPFFLNWNEYVIYKPQMAKLKYLVMLQ